MGDTRETPFQRLTLADLKDPDLHNLNYVLERLYKELGGVTGVYGSVRIPAEVTMQSGRLRDGKAPTEDDQIMTLGATRRMLGLSSASITYISGQTGGIPGGGGGSTTELAVCSASTFNTVIASLPSTGGTIVCASGDWRFDAAIEIPASKSNVAIVGKGPGTVFHRTADMAAGKGLFNVRGSHTLLANFTIDGGVTTPAEKQRGTLTGVNGGDDPMHADLVLNTSIWVHGGSDDVVLQDLFITHTGGYAVLIDARDSDVTNVLIKGIRFINNRPHMFGVSDADKKYGSWTGGIHWQNDGRASASKTYAVYGLTVQGCRFERQTGNCLWGHGYGFDTLNRDINLIGNSFRDTGLDGILCGNMEGGSVKGNTFYRIGYMPTDPTSDDSAWAPAWDPNSGPCAVALDSTGVVRACDYTGNTMMQVNGEILDGDGYSDGTISANVGIIALDSDPYYASDQVAIYGPGGTGNCTRGITVGNSFEPRGGRNINFIGNTFINCLGGCCFGDIRDSSVKANVIWQASAAYDEFIPITLINLGEDDDHRCHGNVVTGNSITFNESTKPCIKELDASWGVSHPFTSADVNVIAGNYVFGTNAGEAALSANSSSTTRVDLSTTERAFSVLTDTNYNSVRANSYDDRHGLLRYDSSSKKAMISTGTDAGARVWKELAGVAGADKQVQFNDNGTMAGSANLTFDKTLQRLTVTGIATKSSIVAVNSFMYADEGFYSPSALYNAFHAPDGGITCKQYTFIPITTGPPTTPGYGVLYFDDTLKKFRYSENGSDYLPFGVASTLQLANTVPIQAAKSTGTLANVFLMGADDSLYIDNTEAPAGNIFLRVPTNQYVVVGAHSGGSALVPNPNGTGVDLGSSVAGYQWRNLYMSGSLGIGVTPSYKLHVAGSAGAAGIVLTGGYMSADQGYYSSYVNDAVNCPNGSVTGKYCTASESLVMQNNAGASLSVAGQVKLRSNGGTLQVSQNGGAWANVIGAAAVTGVYAGTGISVNANTGNVTVTNSGVTANYGGTGVTVNVNTGAVTISIGQSVATNASVNFSTVTASSAAGNAIQTSSGGIQAAGALTALGGVWNAVQAYNGGIFAYTSFYIGRADGTHYDGQTVDVIYKNASGTNSTLNFRGGILVGYS